MLPSLLSGKKTAEAKHLFPTLRKCVGCNCDCGACCDGEHCGRHHRDCHVRCPW